MVGSCQIQLTLAALCHKAQIVSRMLIYVVKIVPFVQLFEDKFGKELLWNSRRQVSNNVNAITLFKPHWISFLGFLAWLKLGSFQNVIWS